jgi:hypothetical protein
MNGNERWQQCACVLCFWEVEGTKASDRSSCQTAVTNLMESAFDVSNCELTSSLKCAASLLSVGKIRGRLPSFSHRGKANVLVPSSVFHSLLGRLRLLLASFIQGVSQIYFWTCKSYLKRHGHTVVQLVDALRYKPEGRWFDSRWCHRNFFDIILPATIWPWGWLSH